MKGWYTIKSNNLNLIDLFNLSKQCLLYSTVQANWTKIILFKMLADVCTFFSEKAWKTIF